MKSHEVLRTAIKIGGFALLIYTAIQASSVLPLVLGQLNATGVDFPTATIIATFVVPMIFGFVLWLFPAPIASTIIKRDLPARSEEKLLVGIEKIAIRVLGLYLLYRGITDFVSNYASYYQATAMFGKNVNFSGNEKFVVGFIVTAAEILLALMITLGATGITNLLKKARNAS